MSIWREPAQETSEYPGLYVHDGRVSGSITVSQSRLPIRAFVGYDGWSSVVESWPYIETEYNWDFNTHASFLRHLLEARGEFARLLLTMANAERESENQWHDANDQHFQQNHANGEICKCGTDELPGPWWQDPALVADVRQALTACLDSLPVVEDVPLESS